MALLLKCEVCAHVYTRADPASEDSGAIEVMFGSLVSLRFTTARKMKHTSQHCSDKTTDSKMALHRECCFLNCSISWWTNLHSHRF